VDCIFPTPGHRHKLRGGCPLGPPAPSADGSVLDPAKICTSHVERQNPTIRMSMRRLTRLTNAFSKKWENLWAAYCLHFAWYNFCRVHKTLRVTPAMESGLAQKCGIWQI
jgi:hypothetical protein